MDASRSRSSCQEITDGLREWRLGILEKEGLEEWKVRDGEPYCWTPIETVKVWTGSRPAIFLHEVAHALYQQPEGPMHNHYHGGNWAAEYGRLVDTYLEPRQPYPFSLRAWAWGRLVSFARHVWWNSCRTARMYWPWALGGGSDQGEGA